MAQLWKIQEDATGHCVVHFLAALEGHPASLNAVRFSPDGEGVGVLWLFAAAAQLFTRKQLRRYNAGNCRRGVHCNAVEAAPAHCFLG